MGKLAIFTVPSALVLLKTQLLGAKLPVKPFWTTDDVPVKVTFVPGHAGAGAVPALTVGEALIFTKTAVRVGLSKPETVCEA